MELTLLLWPRASYTMPRLQAPHELMPSVSLRLGGIWFSRLENQVSWRRDMSEPTGGKGLKPLTAGGFVCPDTCSKHPLPPRTGTDTLWRQKQGSGLL